MEQVKNALVKRTDGTVAKIERLDTQLDLMQHKFRLPPTMCETHRIVQRPDGMFALVKRSAPISIYEDGNGQRKAVGAPAPSHRAGFQIRPRGKYNDEERLTMLNPQGASLRPQEVAAAALM